VSISIQGPGWIQVAIAGAFCLGGFYYAFRNLLRARIIEDVPTARIRSAPQGYIELEGDAEAGPDGPLSSPLTDSACCWFRYKIEKRQGKDWSTLEEDSSAALFVLRDDTGVCLVRPENAEVTPTDKSIWYGDERHPTDRRPQRRRLDAGLFDDVEFSVVSGRYRYLEERIYPGDRVYAIGRFHTEGEPERRREKTLLIRELLRQWKRNKTNLHARFDRNGDGHIDTEEWEAARQAAAREAGVSQKVALRSRILDSLSDPDDGSHPFLISSQPQFQLARRYRRNAGLSLIPFFGGGIAVVAMLFL